MLFTWSRSHRKYRINNPMSEIIAISQKNVFIQFSAQHLDGIKWEYYLSILNNLEAGSILCPFYVCSGINHLRTN